jgi:hypothetical protein
MSPVMLGRRLDNPRNTAILQTSKGALAFRQGSWKIRFSRPTIWHGTKPELPEKGPELYDLSKDPGEQNDLSKKKPKRVKEMSKRLEDLLKQGRSR